jgi:hypothetical protein
LFNKYIFYETELNSILYSNVYTMEEITNNDTTIDECQELKNIKYKTMLLNGAPLSETKSSNDLSNLEKFLEAEKINNSNEPWCKLNKTIKTKKLLDFVEIYSKEKNLDENESKLLTVFLKDSIDKKKLSRVKDVIYDKISGIIKEIPALTYTKSNKHFTLKNIDKRVSTLKSLAPKKVNGTIRHKEISENIKDDSESDDEK